MARVSERTPGKSTQGPLTFIHPSWISLAVGGCRPILVVNRIDVGRCLPTAGAEPGPAGATRGKRDGRLGHVVVVVALEEVVTHPLRIHRPVLGPVEPGARERRVYMGGGDIVVRGGPRLSLAPPQHEKLPAQPPFVFILAASARFPRCPARPAPGG